MHWRTNRAAILALLVATSLQAEQSVFVDQAAAAGIDFVHFNGMDGQLYFPEIVGAGAAFLDYDRDGDLDVYLVQGDLLGPDRSFSSALIPPRHPTPLTDRLYRNDSSESAGLRFTDVTEEAGLPAGGYGIGVSVGDINNDGWPDLYLSNFGSNRLLINRGDGRFEDMTEKAGVDDPGWSSTAVFFDYDRDGWQDIYVVNYVDYSVTDVKTCRAYNDSPDYCGPQSFLQLGDRLFRNRGDGTFEDTSKRSGIGRGKGPGLGAVAGDFNGDGWPDLYVANDGAVNFLWTNDTKGGFKDYALLAGVAVNMVGKPEASMGVDAADFDADGDLDLFMTHLNRETNTLYLNDGKGWFIDQTGRSGLGASSMAFTGFGTRWFDYDNDGWLDLLSANGAVIKIEEQDEAGDVFPLKQSNQLWRNLGNGSYQDVSDLAGPAFKQPLVSRGAAFGDIDNDGDIDTLITNCAGPAQLLINQIGQTKSWIGLQLLLPDGRQSAIGAKATVIAGQRRLAAYARTDGSYASAHDPRILIGLGEHEKPVSVELNWADGTRQEISNLQINRYHSIQQAAPEPAKP
jgi:hypothetical protein